MGQFDNADLAGFGPALDRDLAVAAIDADDDASGMIGGGATHQIGVAQRGGAEHDPVDADIEPSVDRGTLADTATKLDMDINRATDGPHRLAVDRTAGESAVE